MLPCYFLLKHPNREIENVLTFEVMGLVGWWNLKFIVKATERIPRLRFVQIVLNRIFLSWLTQIFSREARFDI